MAKRYVPYEQREEFFELVCLGMSIQAAASAAGVSVTAGTSWWRSSGLMSPVIQFGAVGGLPGTAPAGVPGVRGPDEAPRSRRPLTTFDRSAIAVGLMCGCSYGQIGSMIGRNKSVVCRESPATAARTGEPPRDVWRLHSLEG